MTAPGEENLATALDGLPQWTPLPWDNLPPDPRESWNVCQGVGGDCGIQYPTGWSELAWHLVHQCCQAEIEECPGEGCLCQAPLAVIQHWCEACDGEDPRGCPERLKAERLGDQHYEGVSVRQEGEQPRCGYTKRHPSHTFMRLDVLFQCPGEQGTEGRR